MARMAGAGILVALSAEEWFVMRRGVHASYLLGREQQRSRRRGVSKGHLDRAGLSRTLLRRSKLRLRALELLRAVGEVVAVALAARPPAARELHLAMCDEVLEALHVLAQSATACACCRFLGFVLLPQGLKTVAFCAVRTLEARRDTREVGATVCRIP
jgi:hypothetical protein